MWRTWSRRCFVNLNDDSAFAESLPVWREGFHIFFFSNVPDYDKMNNGYFFGALYPEREGIMTAAEKLMELLRLQARTAVVIHDPANIFYLTEGYTGEGLVYLSAERKVIVTDFRYTETAGSRFRLRHDQPGEKGREMGGGVLRGGRNQ